MWYHGFSKGGVEKGGEEGRGSNLLCHYTKQHKAAFPKIHHKDPWINTETAKLFETMQWILFSCMKVYIQYCPFKKVPQSSKQHGSSKVSIKDILFSDIKGFHYPRPHAKGGCEMSSISVARPQHKPAFLRVHAKANRPHRLLSSIKYCGVVSTKGCCPLWNTDFHGNKTQRLKIALWNSV